MAPLPESTAPFKPTVWMACSDVCVYMASVADIIKDYGSSDSVCVYPFGNLLRVSEFSEAELNCYFRYV